MKPTYARTNKALKLEKPPEDKPSIHAQQGEAVYPYLLHP